MTEQLRARSRAPLHEPRHFVSGPNVKMDRGIRALRYLTYRGNNLLEERLHQVALRRGINVISTCPGSGLELDYIDSAERAGACIRRLAVLVNSSPGALPNGGIGPPASVCLLKRCFELPIRSSDMRRQGADAVLRIVVLDRHKDANQSPRWQLMLRQLTERCKRQLLDLIFIR